ncbi:B lymphocyte-induced maturation protein 1 homolog [Amphibalanus amphitrite]|uniref:B lymphocyte-induced maturation protein 1 homolog n=1 Tax=Amphibalanus amphitrite TaxID=1232801 RepID=UPI001C9162CF|nr:B lymphocyte-induced maturation protein 1 homolog [Amphibalanus amphitrite]XP_043194814.1 B lymphocyte-induced maturation protein 1 homolog [Amphibalanus amphitrite]
MKLYQQTSPDSVQAWTQEDFGFPIDSKAGLVSSLDHLFRPSSPAPSSSSAISCAAASSSFAELKPVPPLKALTQCDFVGSSVGEVDSQSYYPEPGPGTPEVVSTTSVSIGELSDSVMLKPAEPVSLESDFSTTDIAADDDFASIIGNAMVDPQLVVPENLELGSFTSSDMHELEAWIDGQSQAARHSAAASLPPPAHTTLQYGGSPMLQNLLSGHSYAPARAPPPPGYGGMLPGGPSGPLHQRLQKPLSTYSPPSYSSDQATSSSTESAASAKKRRALARSFIKMSIVSEGTKDRPMHRCTICNRPFLNKSNIKVHLRTHTGEKPFKCETCGKAFRQKAHLLKHYHIHKRISRD